MSLVSNDIAAGPADAMHGPMVSATPACPASAGGRSPFSIEWAAGFVDGEACIGIIRQGHKGRSKPTYRVNLSIDQNHLAVLEHLQAGLGGAGRIYKVTRKRQHKRQVYTLVLTGIRALTAIQALRPHLMRKGPEADAVWAFWRQAHGGKRPGRKGWPPEVHALREYFYRQLQSLK